MHVIDSFRRYRRSEPVILFGVRTFTMIMLLAGLLVYITIVAIFIRNDIPMITTSYIEADAIRTPNFAFSCYYKFRLNCTEMYFKSNEVQPTMTDCSQDIIQPDIKYGAFYRGAYRSSKDALLKKSESHNTMSFVGIGIESIDDITPEIPIIVFNVAAFDPENDPLTDYIRDKKYYELTSSEVFNYANFGTSQYYLMSDQFYQFQYSRKVKKEIKPSWMNNIGFPPTYESKPYITSTLSTSPLPSNFEQSNVTTFISIKQPINTVVQVDSEIRSYTIIKSLGLIGGVWGIAMTIYRFLFGADMLRPWGVVQLHCCGFSRRSQNKLIKTFPIIPFFDTSNPDANNHPSRDVLPLDKQNKLRIDSLELFLQEYVIDVNYLDGIRNRKLASSRVYSSNLIRNSAENTI